MPRAIPERPAAVGRPDGLTQPAAMFTPDDFPRGTLAAILTRHGGTIIRSMNQMRSPDPAVRYAGADLAYEAVVNLRETLERVSAVALGVMRVDHPARREEGAEHGG